MTAFLLLRHGQSTWNAEGRWQGWADAPLSARGESQAVEAADHLRSLGLTGAVCSDLQRAKRTAEIIAEALGLGEPTVEAGLRERDVGPFTGLTKAEIRARWPEAFDPETGHVARPPEGETDDDLLARVLPALVRIETALAGERVLTISHGGVLRALERHCGIGTPAATPNLAGRWYEVVGSDITPGDPVVPIEPSHVTTPRSL
ncbi:MAG: histidine phosphatase family protein [Acidimicrobiales bacterium]